MQFTSDLRLVFPITLDERGDPVLWAYHSPISLDVFNANYRIISATKHELFGKGIQYAYENGLRIAALAMRDASASDAQERGIVDAAASALLAEIKRLTLVLAPSESGFESLPVDIAMKNGAIDAQDWAEAEAALVFFTCAFAMAPRAGREIVARSAALVLRGSMTLLSVTEFAASLPISTPEETSVTTDPSSVPS